MKCSPEIAHEVLPAELSAQVPAEIWQVIFSHLPSATHSLNSFELVNKLFLRLVQDLTRSRLYAYFPSLKTHSDYQSAPLGLIIKQYQCYQKMLPHIPMSVILAAFDGKIESIFCEENPNSKKSLYALLIANGHSLPEEIDESEILAIKGEALRYAAKNGNLTVLNLLLSQPKISDLHKEFALRHAVLNGHLAIVNALLLEPGISNIAKGLVFCDAATNGYLDIVNVLLLQPVFPYKGLALQNAAEYGHLAVVNAILLQPGIFSNDKGKALCNAAYYNHPAIVNVLLLQPEIFNEDKGRALYYAAANGHLAVVNALLLQLGISNKDKYKALRVAVKNSHFSIIAAFLLRYLGAAIGIAIGAITGILYLGPILTVFNMVIGGLVGHYLSGIYFEKRQAYLRMAAQKYDSPQKVDSIKNPMEQTALKMGLEAKTWRGYFNSFSFTKKEGYYYRDAFNAGMTFGMNKNKEMIEKIHSIKVSSL